MATKHLLILLSFGILSYHSEIQENKPVSNPVQIDIIVLDNIYNGKFIGCKYQNLCLVDRICYNDLLFGTCLRKDEEANFIYELVPEFQNILELSMRDLFEENYKWGDFYTQCFMQSVLISSEMQQFLDVRHCKPPRRGSKAPPYLPQELRDRPQSNGLEDRRENRIVDRSDNQMDNGMDNRIEDRLENRMGDSLVDRSENRQDDRSENRIDDRLGDRLENRIDERLRDLPENRIGDRLGDNPENRMEDLSRDNPEKQMEDRLRNLPEIRMEDRPRDLPENRMEDRLRDLPENRIGDRLGDNPENQMEDRLRNLPENRMEDRLGDNPENRMADLPRDNPENRMKARIETEPYIESYWANSDSVTPEIVRNEKRSDPSYRNSEVINPKSNSEEAISSTKVNYADPRLVRKLLKVAKRDPTEWIWLQFDNRIREPNVSLISDSIKNSMHVSLKIGKSRWNPDNSVLYFKLMPDSRIHAANITNYLNNHRNIIPGLTILKTGTGIQSSIITEEISTGQNFIITLITCSIVFLGVILVLIGFCVQKFRYKRDKLGDIIKSKFSENSSSSYKELFRGTTNKEAGSVKNKQGVTRVNNKQHSGDPPVASSPVSTRSSTSSWTDEMQVATNMDIYTGHMILSYMEKHLNDKAIFQTEWNSILSYEAEDAKSDVAIKIENLPKNRYQDKIPYDKSRVVLKNQKDGDYINASLIVDHDPKIPVYIATQAPLEKRVADFWQMVWEQGVVVIVNLTELNESDGSQYWPKEGSQIFSIYEVNLVSEHIWSDEYLVRNFYLKNLDTAETRTVTQFHFVSWHIDKLPNSSRSILEFRRKVNKSYRSKSTPIVIHCNDGCGRTGTYILLDLILNRICKGLKEMDIAATLEHLRDQRMHLVKTEEQFGFVLTTISEEVNNILKILNQ